MHVPATDTQVQGPQPLVWDQIVDVLQNIYTNVFNRQKGICQQCLLPHLTAVHMARLRLVRHIPVIPTLPAEREPREAP